jgi:chromosome segregation ATPase
MTGEEMERAIQFIIEQQSRFAADMQQMKEQFAAEMQRIESRFGEQLGKQGEAIIALTGMVGRIAEAHIKTEAKVAELAESQARTNSEMAELAGRLNDFILVVERYISEGRNGK